MIFLQTFLVVNFYCFAYRHTTHIIFLFTSNHSSSIFLILVTIKKFIDVKSKIKYTSKKKKKSSTTKITSKTKYKIKFN